MGRHLSTVKVQKMPKRKYPVRPIRTLSDLPPSGLVLLESVLSTPDDVRLIPFSNATWRRRVARGEAPPYVKWFGRLSCHAEHVCAIVHGRDWRTVKLAEAVA